MTPENPNLENIPGVSPERRDESQSVVSPEAVVSKIVTLRETIEEKGAERIRAGLDRAVIIVEDTPKYAEFLTRKTLSGSARSGDVRYTPEGEIKLPTYQPVKTRLVEDPEGRVKKRFRDNLGEIVEGIFKREIVNPKRRRFLVEWPRGRKEDYLYNLPAGRDVRRKTISTLKTIEDAIDQQKDIIAYLGWGEVAGAEVELAKRIIEYTEGIASRFLLRRRVTKEDLEVLAAETGRFLEGAGLYDPKDKRKSEAQAFLREASQFDIRGRANWLKLVSEILAARARAVYRLTAMGRMVGKFDRNLREMANKRELWRWGFELVARQLEFILENHPAFSRPGAVVSMQERHTLVEAMGYPVRMHLSKPKVNPYLRSARWAAINIVGCKEERKEENKKILGEEIAQKLFLQPEFTPVTDLIMQGKFFEARRRTRLSIRQLRKTNTDYEDIKRTGKA